MGNVSLAYANGYFWLAWKSYDSTQDVQWVRRDASSSQYSNGWGSIQSLGRTKVVDAPTWLYYNNVSHVSLESGLIWTER